MLCFIQPIQLKSAHHTFFRPVKRGIHALSTSRNCAPRITTRTHLLNRDYIRNLPRPQRSSTYQRFNSGFASQSASNVHECLQALTQAELPYISGTFPLSPSQSKLFYQSNTGTTRLLDLSAHDEAELKALVSACEPATFGLGGQDVMDETYRRALKMDVERFSAQFSPFNYGLVDIIREDLLKGDLSRGISVELYKLNVYGPGSFFKAHVDTPRAQSMFGSLVVVLPTKHEGGSLLFRHKGKEWTFDSANAITSSESDPKGVKAAFAAFYGDVEHEVTPVISGYRVTLTYNLHFTDPSTQNSFREETEATGRVKHSLKALLDDENFLPNGGQLAFKLSHKYPVSKEVDLDETNIKATLKGSDARILLALDALGVKSSVNIFYEMFDDDSMCYMLRRPIEDGFDEAGEAVESLLDRPHAKHVYYLNLQNCFEDISKIPQPEDVYDRRPADPVFWVNANAKSGTEVESPYLAYGNHSELCYFYGEVAIVADIKPRELRRAVNVEGKKSN